MTDEAMRHASSQSESEDRDKSMRLRRIKGFFVAFSVRRRARKFKELRESLLDASSQPDFLETSSRFSIQFSSLDRAALRRLAADYVETERKSIKLVLGQLASMVLMRLVLVVGLAIWLEDLVRPIIALLVGTSVASLAGRVTADPNNPRSWRSGGLILIIAGVSTALSFFLLSAGGHTLEVLSSQSWSSLLEQTPKLTIFVSAISLGSVTALCLRLYDLLSRLVVDALQAGMYRTYPRTGVLASLINGMRSLDQDRPLDSESVRVSVLEDIAIAAFGMRRHLARPYLQFLNNTHANIVRQHYNEIANAFGQLSDWVVTPIEDGDQVLRTELSSYFLTILRGHDGELPTLSSPQLTFRRLRGYLGSAAKATLIAVLPLVVILLLRYLDLGIAPEIVSIGITGSVAWAIISTLTMLDPKLDTKIASARNIWEAFRSG